MIDQPEWIHNVVQWGHALVVLWRGETRGVFGPAVVMTVYLFIFLPTATVTVSMTINIVAITRILIVLTHAAELWSSPVIQQQQGFYHALRERVRRNMQR